MPHSLPPPESADDPRLDVPLVDLEGLPTRALNFASARQWTTLRDFLSVHPSGFTTERNIGRKTLRETESAITKALGLPWVEAWALLVDPAMRANLSPQGDLSSPAARWARLGRTPRVDEIVLTAVDLPARMRTFLTREGITSTSQLLAYAWPALLEADWLGRVTVPATLDALETALHTLDHPDALASSAHWREALQLMFAELSSESRLVLTQRAGLTGAVLTLKEAGEMLGVTRERARQLEVAGIQQLQRKLAAHHWRVRLEALVHAPWTAWRALGDPFFAAEPDDFPTLTIFLEILETDVRLERFDEQLHATRLDSTQVAALRQRAEQVPHKLTYPFPASELRERFAAALGAWAEYTDTLLPLVEDRWIVEDGKVLSFGSRRHDELRAFLRARGGPVHRSEVESITKAWPDDVVLIDSSMLMLRENIPGWGSWVERAGQLSADFMREQGPERQWSSFELYPLIVESAQTPTWLNPHSLGSLLKESLHVRYLGRHTVSLGEQAGTARVHFDDLTKALLERHGGPMPEAELRALVERERTVKDLTWTGLLRRHPFVLLGEQRVGLMPRDVPGGEEAIARFVTALESSLRVAGKGWSRADLTAFLTTLETPLRQWDEPLARSVVRQSPRFRIGKGSGGPIGLAEWNEVRAPSQVDVLSELVDAGGGLCTVTEATAVIPTNSGEPMPRAQMLLLAAKAGCSVRGEIIRRREAVPAAPALSETLERWLAALPEEAAPHARQLVGLRDSESPSVAVDAWEKRLLAAAETESAIEPMQVQRLARCARELLEREADGDRREAVLAAVRYLCSEVDARNDLIVGGLDDDQGVLEATKELLVG